MSNHVYLLALPTSLEVGTATSPKGIQTPSDMPTSNSSQQHISSIGRNSKQFSSDSNRSFTFQPKILSSRPKLPGTLPPRPSPVDIRGSRCSSGSSTIKASPAAPKDPKDAGVSETGTSSPSQHFVDAKGNPFTLVEIPNDVRTLKWNTADWTWGVVERLFQDCEQAKVSFEMESYVDEETGKTKKRVKLDNNGMHAGTATGWWFDGSSSAA
jgi:hypothetical protein